MSIFKHFLGFNSPIDPLFCYFPECIVVVFKSVLVTAGCRLLGAPFPSSVFSASYT